MQLPIEKEFREFVELLNAHEVRYLVVGGYAVNYHGYPRYTKDIDFWLWLHHENADRILKVVEEFGFGSMGFEQEDFLKPGMIFQFGREPKRIDLIMDLSGLDFEECYARRETIGVSGLAIDFISLTDLIESKHRAGRLQDLADADELSKLNAEIKKVEAGLIELPDHLKRKK